MNNSKLHSVLSTQIVLINDQLNKITHGGCGRAALSLHKALTNKGIASDIVLVDHIYDSYDISMMLSTMGKGDINEAYMSMFEGLDPEYDDTVTSTCNGHICVKVDGTLYDTDGEYDGEAISDGITAATMEVFVTMRECWNGVFAYANCDDYHIDETFDHFFEQLLVEI